MFLRGVLLSAIVGLYACGKSDSSSEEGAAASSDVNMALNMQVVNGGVAALLDPSYGLNVGPEASSFVCKSSDRTTTGSDSEFSAQYGASGAPEEMKIKVKRLILTSSITETNSTIFESTEEGGTELTLTSGTVDVSSLTLATSLKDATYTRLSIVLANEAKIKGCITEQFQSNSSECTGRDAGACEAFSTAGPEAKTFCTKSAYDLFETLSGDETVLRSVYEGGSAEETSVALKTKIQSGQTIGEKTDEVTIEFDLPQYLVVGSGTGATTETADGEGTIEEPVIVETDLELAMVLDMNVMLGFDGNARGDTTHAYGMAYGDIKAAYFHTQDLKEYMRIFVGKVGSVEGYHSDVCYNNTGSEWNHQKSWITLIFGTDAAGTEDTLLTGVIAPYDTTGLVLLKGNINSTTHSKYPSVVSGTTYKLHMGRTFEDKEEVSFLGGFTRGSAVGQTTTIDATADDQVLFNNTEAMNVSDGEAYPAFFYNTRKL